ncbi:UDP-N-acetylmuramoyl-tripeptide--D-alanyl-D-alanine ligase [bacterium]|nr:UDP-N-acetylmuramoyl-tripeptide--D-alanyl-D-alanine ligase [bacterium]
MKLTLGETADLFNAALSSKERVKNVESVETDSNKCGKGSLFFALKGERFDGHDFVNNVRENGGIGAVVERDVNISEEGGPFALIYVDNTLKALQYLASFYRSKFNLPVAGITGSNGKTTTKEMTASVLSKKYKVVKTSGNLNNHIGVPLTILSWKDEPEFAVLEMGANHIGEIKNLCSIAKPEYGVITNIGRGHIGFFGSIDNIFKAKRELADSLPEGGTLFLNGDDERLNRIKLNNVKIIRYGFSSKCDIKGSNPRINSGGNAVMDFNGAVVTLNLPGLHNLYNGLAAAAVGIYTGVSLRDIQESLEEFRAVDKRTDVVFTNPFILINDAYNANPDSMEAAFAAAKEMAGQGTNLIAVLGDMFELGKYSRKEHQSAGEKLGLYGFNTLFCIGRDMAYTAETAEKSGLIHVSHYLSQKDLIRNLIGYISPNDVVLVKGSRGMQMEKVVDELKQLKFQNAGE